MRMAGASRGGRRAAAAALAAAAGLAVVHAGPGITGLAPVRRRLFPRLCGRGEPGHVALTFDDGPDPAYTPAVLEVLAAHGAQATFFMLGPMVVTAPGLAASIAAAGHEVAVHGWEHRYTIIRTPRAVREDMARARDTIAEATGSAPRFYRPPYGVLSAGALASARELGLTPVLWDCWGREWLPGSSPASVHDTVAKDLGAGSCVLLHDSDCTSPQGSAAAVLGALPRLLDTCSAQGLRVGRLADHGM